jgi:hypothetical protein
MDEYQCRKCSKSFNSYGSLRKHTSKIHKIQSQQFYVDFYLGGVWPKCKCGCGQKVKWAYQLKNFRYYCAGHQSRIKNNWGNNPVALKRSIETRRKRFALGEITTWNSGLTIEDQRVKINAEKSKKAINSNPEELKRRSELMKTNRLNGIIPTLYGPDSSQWKGGVSEIANIARANKRLYDEWKYPILIRDGFRCTECGNTKPLHVHHDKEKFCEITEKHMPDGVLVVDFELKKSIAEKIVDYHIKNNVSGVTLCNECHEKYHPALNF